MSVKPFAAGNTLESLRDSDFDSCSAYGEVVDNSLQANATEIKIHFDKTKIRDGVERVIFMDNGHGMNVDLLQNCLRLGWSSRYNDRSGIGRFGVGMTLGAIHECRRVEVYSKASSGEWLFTYLDLDEIEDFDKEGKEWVIPTPLKKSPTDQVTDHYIPHDSGTIVVWSKYDRAQNKLTKILEEFRIWVGRTFRHYIWGSDGLRECGPVKIYLNGSIVKAIDPLYVKTELTNFPDDPPATLYKDVEFDWPIGDPKIENSLGKQTGKVIIKLSLLPKEFREYQGAGGSKESNDRSINLNEGFSFIRRGREVGYDWIPHFKFGSEDKDRFWGCEINFEPELDRAFTVKNIKRGAVPSSELKKALADKIGPWIKTQRELITEHWKKASNPPKGTDLPTGGQGHLPAEKIVDTTPGPKGKIGIDKDKGEGIPYVAEMLGDGDPEEKARWEAKFSSQKFTIGEKSWLGPTFIDIHFMGGHDAILYNTRHKFFEVLSIIRNEVLSGANSVENSERLVLLIDVLLVAYARSESMMDPDEQLRTIDLLDQLKNHWGQFLRSYIMTWEEKYDHDLKL